MIVRIVTPDFHPVFGGAAFVRIRTAVNKAIEKSQGAAELLSVLVLSPGAMIAFVFALWRMGQDFGWTTNFVVSDGLFSHWLAWGALALLLLRLRNMSTRIGDARRLEKYAETRGNGTSV